MVKKYKYQDEVMPPSLFTSLSGKCYIVPSWQEVDPGTKLEDIEWIKPKIKEKRFIFTKKYNTRYDSIKKQYKCDCPGFFRVKDKDLGCKHIQALKKLNEK